MGEAQRATRGPGGGGPGQPGMMRGPMGGPMGYLGAMPMYVQRPGPAGAMQPAYPMMPQMMGPGGRGPAPARGAGSTGRGNRSAPIPGRGATGQQPIKFNQQARNATPSQSMPPGSSQQSAQGQSPTEAALTASALASATPEMQKNMIGERLYPLIHQSQPELAGKITGMLLEMDNSELLHLLESPDALNAKISEALQVLEAHNSNA